MSMTRDDLETYLNGLLAIDSFKDYCPNGLQVEGSDVIETIVTGVTASMELIEAAIAHNAQAIIVHHGYFWKGESPCLTGIKKHRIQQLLDHGISLFAYHLPLDQHETLGNNVQLAKQMNWSIHGPLGNTVGLQGVLNEAKSADSLQNQLANELGYEPQHIGDANKSIKSLAWCTGAAQGYLEQAISAGVDAFISGEISEQTVHLAKESGVNYFAAGHHATETGGVRALAAHLKSEKKVDAVFVDLPIPV